MCSGALYPGETILKPGEYPALTKFIKGDPQKPLAVFIPGAANTARIAYGGHPGGRDEDFLAYWLKKRGYSFLGVSYPIETANPIYERSYPDFGVKAWGRQAAEISKHVIEQNRLNRHIIIIGWSMSGRIAPAFSKSAEDLGLIVDFFVSLSSTPAVMNAMGLARPPKITLRENGYEDRTGVFDKFYKLIEDNSSENGGRTVIPKDVCLRDYFGSIPVNIEGNGWRLRDNGLVEDSVEFIKESGCFQFADFPFAATIYSENPADPLYSMYDLSNFGCWSLYQVNKVVSGYVGANRALFANLEPERFFCLCKLIKSAPQRLSAVTHGNHFFFVGEKGASETAALIQKLETEVRGFKSELGALLHVDIQ